MFVIFTQSFILPNFFRPQSLFLSLPGHDLYSIHRPQCRPALFAEMRGIAVPTIRKIMHVKSFGRESFDKKWQQASHVPFEMADFFYPLITYSARRNFVQYSISFSFFHFSVIQISKLQVGEDAMSMWTSTSALDTTRGQKLCPNSQI